MEHNGSIQQIPPGIRDISYSAVSGSTTTAAPRQHQNCVIHLLLSATGAGRHQTVPVSANTTISPDRPPSRNSIPGTPGPCGLSARSSVGLSVLVRPAGRHYISMHLPFSAHGLFFLSTA